VVKLCQINRKESGSRHCVHIVTVMLLAMTYIMYRLIRCVTKQYRCVCVSCSRRLMSTLLLNHVAAVNDINSPQCISSFSTPPGTGGLVAGLGGCLGGVGVSRDPMGGLGVGGAGTWPHTDYGDADTCLSYDASSAAVVAAARFMQGYRNHNHYHQHQQQPPNSSTSASSGYQCSLVCPCMFD